MNDTGTGPEIRTRRGPRRRRTALGVRAVVAVVGPAFAAAAPAVAGESLGGTGTAGADADSAGGGAPHRVGTGVDSAGTAALAGISVADLAGGGAPRRVGTGAGSAGIGVADPAGVDLADLSWRALRPRPAVRVRSWTSDRRGPRAAPRAVATCSRSP